MKCLDYALINVGDNLPQLVKPPITRTTLALFAGASNDHNSIHIDIDYAKSAGMDDVLAHGMLGMAYLAQLLTGWVDQRSIRNFSVRFSSIMQVKDEISCTGLVTDKFEEGGENRLRLSVQAHNQDGEVKLDGTAVIAI